jgi:hypothetical protein
LTTFGRQASNAGRICLVSGKFILEGSIHQRGRPIHALGQGSKALPCLRRDARGLTSALIPQTIGVTCESYV